MFVQSGIYVNACLCVCVCIDLYNVYILHILVIEMMHHDKTPAGSET